MGISLADAIRASRLARLHHRPDIRLQPSLLLRHTINSLAIREARPYRSFPRFRVIKRQFWLVRMRLRGLATNMAHIVALVALLNL